MERLPVIAEGSVPVSERLKMYDEDLVREIMISTALCVQELLMDDPQAHQDDVFEFVETNYRHIITETLRAEREREMTGEAENGPEDLLSPPDEP